MQENLEKHFSSELKVISQRTILIGIHNSGEIPTGIRIPQPSTLISIGILETSHYLHSLSNFNALSFLCF